MSIDKEIRNGFNAMAGGVKEAGRKRILELATKQGYVAFRNPDAVAQFHADPFYADWTCKYENGEIRFYPPVNKGLTLTDTDDKDLKTSPVQEQAPLEEKTPVATPVTSKDLLSCYKEALQKGQIAHFVVQTLADPNLCRVQIILQDKAGNQTVFWEETRGFDSQFAYEVLPSIYNQICGGFPTEGYQKETSIAFFSVDGTRKLSLGGLTPEQMKIVQDMQVFVEQQMFPSESKRER